MPDPGYFTKLRAFLCGRRQSQSTGSRRTKRRAVSAQSAATFALEPLEARVLLAADLAAAVQAVQIVPEQAATVLVTNNGPDRVNNAQVAVHASQDTVLDTSDVSLGSDRVGGNLRAGQSDDVSVRLNFSSLAPGAYHILGSVNDVAVGNPTNNVGVGPRVLKDSDGTVALFSLRGPGQVELIQDGSQWDVRVTGTTDQSVLLLQTRGGNGRVTIDDLHVQGPLGAIVAPTMDLTGTLAVNGPVTAGFLLGSATGAVIAAPTIQGTTFHGVPVQGIGILGPATDTTILIGTDLGADGQFGGTGANADIFGVGTIGRLFINGRFISDVQSPALAAALAQDTGSSGSDGLTQDATITGTASDQSGVTTLRAGFNGVPGVDMSSRLQGGAFTLTPSDLAVINGGTLPDGSYTLTLLARDPNGLGKVTQVAFTLDTTPPPLTLELAPAFDTPPTGDNETTEATVMLVGQTEPNAAVTLLEPNLNTTADANGDFSFTNVSLTLGANTLTAQATDAAGNQRTLERTITRLDSLMNGLISWFPGEGNADDVVGPHDGTPLNGVGFVPGKVGQAFSLDGIDDEIALAHTSALNFGPTDSFTIAAWVKPSAADRVAVSLTYVCSAESIQLTVHPDGKANFWIRDNTDIHRVDLFSPTSIVDGQWHHVVGVRDVASDTLELYVDGVLVASAQDSTIGTFTRPDGADRIGASAAPCPTKRYWSGLIDEVRIYNRALTAGEVQQLANV